MIFHTPVQVLRIPAADIKLDDFRGRFDGDKDSAYKQLSICKVQGDVDVKDWGEVTDTGHGGKHGFHGTVYLPARQLRRFSVSEILTRDRLLIFGKELDIVFVSKEQLGKVTVKFKETDPDRRIVDKRYEASML